MATEPPEVRRPDRLGVVANLSMEDAVEACRRSLEALEAEKDLDILVEERLAKRLRRKSGVPQTEMDVDVMVVAGGDGTILHALHLTDAPVLAINTGSVGFLAELQMDEIEPGLKNLLAGKYCLDERMRLKCLVNGRRSLDATNEVVVHTATVSKMMTMELEVDGNFVDKLRADGIIVATPTGSTSYALSTGGPILDPRVRAMVLTPIAPFNLHSRPMVVPAESVVEISTPEGKYPGLVVIDGQHEVHFRQRTTVELTASDTPAYFIRMDGGFYDKLRNKFISVYPCDVGED